MSTDPEVAKELREEDRDDDREQSRVLNALKAAKDKKAADREEVQLEWQRSSALKNKKQEMLATQVIYSM